MIKRADGTYMHLSKEKEYQVWRILMCEVEGTEQQQTFCESVEDVRLDYHDPDCPESYKAQQMARSAATTNYKAVMGAKRV